MKCVNCGHEYGTGKFCPKCGTAASEFDTENSWASDFGDQSVSGSYSNYEDTSDFGRTPIKPVKPAKRKLPGAVIAIALALVLIAGAVFGILAIVGNGPAAAIGKGLQKTLKSETFNFDITVEADGESMNFVGTIEFNPEEYVLNMYMEGESSESDSTITMCLYDGKFCGYTSDDGDKWYTYTEIDEDILEEFFDAYLENADSKLSKKDLVEALEELDDMADGELSEVVDLEIMADCIMDYAASLNNKKWLKENAGFSQEKKNGTTYYIFEPDLHDFAEASLSFFEEAFEDEDVYEDGMDALEDSLSDLDDISLEITFGVKSGYLSYFMLDVEEVVIEAAFSEFGKAELDYDELDDLLSECEKGYEEQWSDYYGYYD